MCLLAAAPQAASAGDVREETAGEEDAGRTSDEEEGGADGSYERQVGNIHLPCFHGFEFCITNAFKKKQF